MNDGPPYTLGQKLSICLRWNFSRERVNLYKYPCGRADIADFVENVAEAAKAMWRLSLFAFLVITWPIRPIMMLFQAVIYALGNSAAHHCMLEKLDGIMRRRKEKEDSK